MFFCFNIFPNMCQSKRNGIMNLIFFYKLLDIDLKIYLDSCRHSIKQPAVGLQGYERLESNDLNAVLNHVANVGPLGVSMGGLNFIRVRFIHIT